MVTLLRNMRYQEKVLSIVLKVKSDLSSYFDTVHHRLLMKAVRRRISDSRFMTLLWKTIKAGHIDVGLFRAASEGVPQGGVISPLLSNIMNMCFSMKAPMTFS
nr:reverse transcriptase domain-containing protein [Serratia quinivorans]